MATVDLDRVKKAAAHLKANPPTHDEVLKDPKKFLAAHGIKIDAKLEHLITSHKSKGVAAVPRQAAIIHIDA